MTNNTLWRGDPILLIRTRSQNKGLIHTMYKSYNIIHHISYIINQYDTKNISAQIMSAKHVNFSRVLCLYNFQTNISHSEVKIEIAKGLRKDERMIWERRGGPLDGRVANPKGKQGKRDTSNPTKLTIGQARERRSPPSFLLCQDGRERAWSECKCCTDVNCVFLRSLFLVFCQMDPEKGGEESPEPRVDRAGSTEMSTVHVSHLLEIYWRYWWPSMWGFCKKKTTKIQIYWSGTFLIFSEQNIEDTIWQVGCYQINPTTPRGQKFFILHMLVKSRKYISCVMYRNIFPKFCCRSFPWFQSQPSSSKTVSTWTLFSATRTGSPPYGGR